MALKFEMTSEVSSKQGVKALVYGRAGTGKTYLASTAPGPLILSAERGLLSLAKFNIPYITIDTPKDLEEVYKWLTGSKDAKHVKTLYIDSATEIGEKVVAEGKKVVKDPRQAYGLLVDNMVPAIKGFRDLPGLNVVFTAKQQRVKDEVTGAILYSPDMPGNVMPQAMPYLYDLVLNANIGRDNMGKPYHYLRTRPDFQYEAKDRSGRLEEIEYPDLTAIFNKVLGA